MRNSSVSQSVAVSNYLGGTDSWFGIANKTRTANKAEVRLNFDKKRKGTSDPIKSIDDLCLLEKPIYIKSLIGRSGDLPEDIRSLCDTIRNASDFKAGLFPGEIRDRVEEFADRTYPPHCFRDPHPDPEKMYESLMRFLGLYHIVQTTEGSLTYRRNGDGWNHFVHTSLLKTIFGSYDATNRALYHDEQKSVAVRFEPVMSATIAYEWIPRLRRGATSEQIKKATNLSDVACSVSAGSAASLTSSEIEDASHVTVSKDLMHTSANSKRSITYSSWISWTENR